jgi:hypothetical protein
MDLCGCILCTILILLSFSVSIYIFIFEYDTHSGVAIIFLIFDFFGILMVLAYIFAYCHRNMENDELEIDMQQEEYLNRHHHNGVQIYNPTFEIHNIESLNDDDDISHKSLNLEDNFIEYSFIQDNILEDKIEYVIIDI